MKRLAERRIRIAAGACLLIACNVLLLIFLSGQYNPAPEVTTELFAMDTSIGMTAYGPDAEMALTKATEKLKELERLWSVTDVDSDVYALNHSGGRTVRVSSETADLLAFALQMAEETGGALEPTIYPVLNAWGFTTGENRIPSDEEIDALLQDVGYERVRADGRSVRLEDGMMLDLGAIGKGYSGDLIVHVLRDSGVTSALLDIGGNIQAVGTKPDGSPWRLGLSDPFSDGTLGVLEISDGAVVTSGNYERYFIGADGEQYGHIIDPATGRPAETGLASVTVIAEEGRPCDALSTALFVMGTEGAVEYWRQHRDFDMILIAEDGEIDLTDGVAEAFALDSYHSNMKVNVIVHE